MPHCKRILAGGLVLAAVALVTACSGATGSPASSVNLERPWEALPEDVDAVVHVDVVSLRDSELYPVLAGAYEEIPADREGKVREFEEATGFDVRRDLQAITMGAAYDADDGRGPVYAIIRGNFDLERVERFVEDEPDVRKELHGEMVTYRSTSDDDSVPDSTMAWLSDEIMILASTPDFPKLLQSVENGGRAAATSSIQKLMAGSRGQVFAAVRIPEEARQADTGKRNEAGGAMLSGIVDPLRRLETVLLTLSVTSDVDVSVTAEADSEESGQRVQETVQGLLMMGKMMTAESPELATALERLSLEREGRTVRLSMRLTNEQIRTAMSEAQDAAATRRIGG